MSSARRWKAASASRWARSTTARSTSRRAARRSATSTPTGRCASTRCRGSRCTSCQAPRSPRGWASPASRRWDRPWPMRSPDSPAPPCPPCPSPARTWSRPSRDGGVWNRSILQATLSDKEVDWVGQRSPALTGGPLRAFLGPGRRPCRLRFGRGLRQRGLRVLDAGLLLRPPLFVALLLRDGMGRLGPRDRRIVVRARARLVGGFELRLRDVADAVGTGDTLVEGVSEARAALLAFDLVLRRDALFRGLVVLLRQARAHGRTGQCKHGDGDSERIAHIDPSG